VGADRAPAHAPSLAVDGSDRPLVAWSSPDAARVLQVHVSRWSDGAWVPLTNPGGGASATAGRSEWPRVHVSSDEVVHVAWEEVINPGEVEIFYRQLTP